MVVKLGNYITDLTLTKQMPGGVTELHLTAWIFRSHCQSSITLHQNQVETPSFHSFKMANIQDIIKSTNVMPKYFH